LITLLELAHGCASNRLARARRDRDDARMHRSSSPTRARRSRVKLSTAAMCDRDEFVAAMRASRKVHSPWLVAPTTSGAFDRLLARADGERHEWLFLRRREDDALVGFFAISEIVRGSFQSAFLSYGAVAAHAGRGYMTEGLELVLGRAFDGLRLHRLEANIQPRNGKSIALVRRCGFVREGISERYLKVAGRWRDHERWAIRGEQWRERRRGPG
jgi:ribosomal-protein-alanine N-acetyltransferase